jgi:hypothetical protein
MRQQAPRAGRSQDVKQALDNSPQIHFARPPQPLYGRHKRLDRQRPGGHSAAVKVRGIERGLDDRISNKAGFLIPVFLRVKPG